MGSGHPNTGAQPSLCSEGTMGVRMAPLIYFELQLNLNKYYFIIQGKGRKLSKPYAVLLTENEIFDTATSRWEINVKEEILLETWHKISCLFHSFSCNVAFQEYVYKLQHRWHVTPTHLAKYFPNSK